MKTYQLSTNCELIKTETIVDIKEDGETVGVVFFINDEHQIYCNADVKKFQVVNYFDLYARIIRALLDAGDENSENPMRIEGEIDVLL